MTDPTPTARVPWRALLAVLAVSLLAAACGGDDGDATSDTVATPGLVGGEEAEGEAAPEPAAGGRVTVALEFESSGWLPGTNSGMNNSVALTIYDPLVMFDAEQQPRPYLAESVTPNEDLTEWTVTLRPGITFHDGSTLDAEVLKWNFDTLHNVSTSTSFGQLTSAGVEGIEVVDELTVRYLLREPNAAFLDILRQPVGWPVSREAYESMGPEALVAGPVGTGPFVFQEWSRDDRFVATRNPDYWRTDEGGNQLPYLDEVEFRPIPDEDSRFQSLASGTVDVMVTLRGSSAHQVIELAEDGDFGANLHAGSLSNAMVFNVLQPPVDDLRVRQALSLMVTGDDIASVMGDAGLVPPTDGLFSQDSAWYSDAAGDAYISSGGLDADRAADLVEEYVNDPDRSDGRAVGEPVEISVACPIDPTTAAMMQYAESQWAELGIETEILTQEFAAVVQNGIGSADQSPPWSGNFVITCWRVGSDSDPLSPLTSWLGDPAVTPTNITNFTSSEIQEALHTLKVSGDFPTRYAAAETINRISNEESLAIWMVATPAVVGWDGDVHGLVEWTLPDGRLGNATAGGTMQLVEAFRVD
jgi:peptide/nickel transport system substrate-binding protein